MWPFHRHQWLVRRTEKYVVGKGWPKTMLYLKCEGCPKVRIDVIDGHWDAEDFG